ncbi:MAG: putative DNA-binding protein [Clostridium sp.]|uniref:putative DNA-binding protein n=1 Tax=Clostridium sp. TaxID=1506 RepID=UPI0030663C35
MEKRVEISVLLDYYNLLLTDKQRDIMDLYYNKDLSLSEISEINNTSRQAIHDLIKRCNHLLEEYEKKLNLMEKTLTIENSKTKIINKLQQLQSIVSEKNEKETIEYIIEDIIENV